MLTPFIPAHELQTLVKGSHQDLTARIAAAVTESFTSQRVQVLATFNTHAIALSESGTVHKITYECALDGSVQLLKNEELPVTVVTDKTLRRYVQREAADAVGLFLKGLTAQANAKIAALAPLAEAVDLKSDLEIVCRFDESRAVATPWKLLVESRKAAITSYLSEVALPEPLQERFGALYDGSTPSDELPVFEPLVLKDMDVLLTRLAAVEEQSRKSLELLGAIKEAAIAEGQAEAVDQIELLASDLLRDVASVREFAQDAVSEFKQVDLLARVFDSVATEVASFEVASAFAHTVATRLHGGR